jgi:hypothetical protein
LVLRAAGVAVLAATAALPAFAQTPEAPVLPLVPDPARCTVEPRSLDEVRAVWQEVNASPRPSPEAVDPQIAGTPADEATVAAVTQLLVDVIACAANGNSGLADATFLTDEHLRDNLAGLSEEDFAAFYTESPEASPVEAWLMVYALHDIRLLEDGRVAVNPDFIVPGVGRFRDLLILEQVDGRWLIDLSQEGEGNLYP